MVQVGLNLEEELINQKKKDNGGNGLLESGKKCSKGLDLEK